MARSHKDVDWKLPVTEAGALESWAHVDRALLMDLRDQAKEQTQLQREAVCLQRDQLSVLKRMDRRLQQFAKLPRGRAPR